jgi:hypothetical protein
MAPRARFQLYSVIPSGVAGSRSESATESRDLLPLRATMMPRGILTMQADGMGAPPFTRSLRKGGVFT